ncbi:RNA methyltransferase [Pricia sp. S334]|uniref:tRNA (guanosine(18)-2'-O)-methyltransferase n=1 Tax=Pricia mediterranea TaxID=3076079 RepID=A0ABU3LA74_9FLAO|nr:RNA methyltransferase [Pricia sp. S334]MDT7830293.1 RNA methyltransferase [Pricia sp. S334]
MKDAHLLEYLERFISEERKQRFLSILNQRTKYLTIAIEDVYQLHNASAIIRSCESFGLQEVHVIEDRFGKRLDKHIAMGAQRWVDVKRYGQTSDCLSQLKSEGYRIVATTPHAKSRLLDDFEIDGKTALFFGTEKEGLSEEVIAGSDGFLKIPMVGFTESLNVSVSAAIVLQTLTQQLRKSDLPWHLTETEKLEKRLDWTQKSIKSIEAILERYHRSSK